MLRTAINAQFIQHVANNLPKNSFPVRILADFAGKLNGLSRQDIDMVMGLPDNKFGGLAPYLDLVLGMPVVITVNVRTQKQVTNGTTGVIHHIQFPPDTTFQLVRDSRTGVAVQLPNQRPLYALLKLDRGMHAPSISDGYCSELFPVFPDTEPFSYSNIFLTPAQNGHPRTLKCKIRQFPFVCCVGVTAYKLQGATLPSLAVPDWKPAAARANRPEQAYIYVSRVRTREGLHILKPFTRALADWSRPRPEAIEEENRLKKLSEATEQWFDREIVASN